MAAVHIRASDIGLLKQEVCSLRVAGRDQVGRTFAEGLQQEASTSTILGADTSCRELDMLSVLHT